MPGASEASSPAVVVPDAEPAQPTAASSKTAEPPSKGLGVWPIVGLLFGTSIVSATTETILTGETGLITGAIFVIMCALCASLIRYQDLAIAVITPPLAFLTGIVVAGQPILLAGDTDHLIIRQGAMVITGLAANAPWIYAGTGAALIVVAVRRWGLHR